MKSYSVLFKLLAFWLLFFAFQQVLFLGLNWSAIKGGNSAMLGTFLTSLPMNIATACYLSALPVLLFIAVGFGVKANGVNSITKAISYLFIVICSILLCSDISLFQVWGTKINAKALGYLQYPQELAPTVFAWQNAALFLLIAIQIIVGIYLYRVFKIEFTPPTFNKFQHAMISLLCLGALVIGFRGGLQRVPINRNWVFMTNEPALNYASLNSFWNTADLLTHPLEKQENPYVFFPKEEAYALSNTLNTDASDSTISIFNTSKPNIVFVFLESWAADVVESVGGEKGIAPKFGELAKEGILFDRFYSTGYRTEQGFLAALSATPALPVGSVIQTFGKFEKLPNLFRTLHENGYHTSFYSGGRLFFDNIEAYLRSAGVDIMKGENEWTINKRTVWGAYDEELFALHLNETKTLPQPFFSALTTMTTHEWFDADVPALFHGDADPVNDRYRNTMHYADSCLFAYVQEAKKQPWYANTVFVIMADHACKFPKGRNNFETERHHIPMMITGGALKNEWRGKSYSEIASHVDLPATLLAQLGMDKSAFPNSKNLFGNKRNPFAYYTFDNGFGIITPQGNLIYDHNRQLISENTFTDSTAMKAFEKMGKGYLQKQFDMNLGLLYLRSQK